MNTNYGQPIINQSSSINFDHSNLSRFSMVESLVETQQGVPISYHTVIGNSPFDVTQVQERKIVNNIYYQYNGQANNVTFDPSLFCPILPNANVILQNGFGPGHSVVIPYCPQTNGRIVTPTEFMDIDGTRNQFRFHYDQSTSTTDLPYIYK